MAGHPLRPATHRGLGEPLPHQLPNGARAPPQVIACKQRPSLPTGTWVPAGLRGISAPFGTLSPTRGQITHVLLTRAPLYLGLLPFAFDLHVLSTPPAFVLSQDQTLQLVLRVFETFGFGRGLLKVPHDLAHSAPPSFQRASAAVPDFLGRQLIIIGPFGSLVNPRALRRRIGWSGRGSYNLGRRRKIIRFLESPVKGRPGPACRDIQHPIETPRASSSSALDGLASSPYIHP